jgi:hypothetical protein
MGPGQKCKGRGFPGIGIDPECLRPHQNRQWSDFSCDRCDEGRVPGSSTGEDDLVHLADREMVPVGMGHRSCGEGSKCGKQIVPVARGTRGARLDNGNQATVPETLSPRRTWRWHFEEGVIKKGVQEVRDNLPPCRPDSVSIDGFLT